MKNFEFKNNPHKSLPLMRLRYNRLEKEERKDKKK